MIRLTYDFFCDLCNRHIDAESFNCSNRLNSVFPHPKNAYTYQIGYVAEICNDCATPIMQARDEVIRQWKEKQV
jgi:hypothetical protein